MTNLPRYTQAQKYADGTRFYRFNPPQKYIELGLVERESLGSDGRTAFARARELNKIISEHQEKERIEKESVPRTLSQVVDVYYNSYYYNKLKNKTQIQYKQFLDTALSTHINNRQLSKFEIKDISAVSANRAYQEWLNRGVHMANHICSAMSMVYNYAINTGYCTVNPFSRIKKETPQQRKIVWTKQDITKFLDVAYSEFEYRNIGLIFQMTYEWCQRLGDIRNLKWNNLNLDRGTVHIEQSKRRAEVSLPISSDLIDMLYEQQEDFGFQDYVAPYYKPKNGSYVPYDMELLSKVGRRIMNFAGLPDTLRMMDLRRTGTTEMIEAGVGLGQVMAVTGHSHPQSVKPYMKNTLSSADFALTQRKNHDISIDKCRKGE